MKSTSNPIIAATVHALAVFVAAGIVAATLSACRGDGPQPEPRAPEPPAIADLECTTSDNQVGLAWSDVDGAEQYEVFRSQGGDFARVAIVDQPAHRDTGLDDTTMYTYFVVAIDRDGSPMDESGRCAVTPIEAGRLPVVALESSSLDQRVLRTFETISASSEQPAIRVRARVIGVDGPWKATVFAAIERSEDEELVGVLRSEPLDLPDGDSVVEETLFLDAGPELVPGAYTVQPIVVVGLGNHVSGELPEVIDLFTGDSYPASMFAAGPEENLQVVDPGAAAIAAYEAAIESGNATTAYKGLSSLVGHYRLRGQYDLAERAINECVRDMSNDPDFTELLPIFEFWNVDNKVLAGDVDGAIETLASLIETTPSEQRFLGEPFRGRGLYELARLHRRNGDMRESIDAYSQLLAEFPAMHRPTVLMERASARLNLSRIGEATADYREVLDAFAECYPSGSSGTGEPPPGVVGPCPLASQASESRRKVRILESDRDWFSEGSGPVLRAIEEAVVTRDIRKLDAVANPVGFRFVLGAGEWLEGDWNFLVRPFLQRVLEDSPDLTVRAGPREEFRQTIMLENIDETAGVGPTGAIALTIDRQANFGWQLSAVNGLPVVAKDAEGEDTFDKCFVDEELGEICLEPGDDAGSNPTPPPGAPSVNASLNIQAPWAPGVHMRAGGLSSAVDFARLGAEALLDIFLTPAFLPSISGRCGAGVPGYYYGIDTHVSPNKFAIDYMQGETSFCIWKICISPPKAVLRELLQVLKDRIFGGPTVNSSFGDPVLAAHAGIVLDSNYTYRDGNVNPDHANRIRIGVWTQSPGISIPEILAAIENVNSFGEALDKSGVDFFLNYLHLRQERPGHTPSRGMWVNQGDWVGAIDDTGKSFTSHLHFVVRMRPTVDPQLSRNWPSVRQIIAGDRLENDENGKCIKSKNELVLIDTDGDGIYDHHDNCLLVTNRDQSDLSGDLVGDACDVDIDGDGIPNEADGCPNNPGQTDFDQDGLEDACDPDADNDGVPREDDRCPLFDDRLDFDGDGAPDGCDPDQDDDGWEDECDPDVARVCGCLNDEAPRDPRSAGDHDLDGREDLDEACPCDHVNPGCRPFDDFGPKDTPGGILRLGYGSIPHGPGGPGDPFDDPFGPGGNPFGPGGYIP